MSDRILYYSASKGRGCIGSVDDDNNLADVRVFPEGSFAGDWTQITALSGDRVLYYSASRGVAALVPSMTTTTSPMFASSRKAVSPGTGRKLLL